RRRSGIIAAYKLLKDAVSFVLQFVVNANPGGVVALNGQALEIEKETDFGQVRHVFVVREDGERGEALLGRGVHKGFSVVVAVHDLNQVKALAPERLAIFINAGAEHLVNVVGDFGGFRAAGMRIGGNDRFGELFDKSVLSGSEEAGSRGSL